MRLEISIVSGFFRENAHDWAVVIAFARRQSYFHKRGITFLRFFWASSNGGTAAASPHAAMHAAAANTTTSKMSGSTLITTPFSKCSGTGALAIISRRKQSSGPGNWWSSAGDFRRNGFMPRFTNRGRTSRANSTRKRTITGRDYFAKPYRSGIHIVNGDKKDNSGCLGDTGRAGRVGIARRSNADGDTRGALVNKTTARIEIWNWFHPVQANPDDRSHCHNVMLIPKGFERVTAIFKARNNSKLFRQISTYETIFSARSSMRSRN